MLYESPLRRIRALSPVVFWAHHHLREGVSHACCWYLAGNVKDDLRGCNRKSRSG